MSKTLNIRGLAIGQGSPRIVVPIVDVTKDGILSSAGTIRTMNADVVEWRCDRFSGGTDIASVTDVLKDLREVLGNIPLLFTFRTAKEGGEKALAPELYAILLKGAASTGFIDLIDVELFTGDEHVKDILASAHARNVFVIASSHDFQKTPGKEEILSRLKKMDILGADILKIAVMPQSRADVITLLDATQEADTLIEKPVVTMSMGRLGLISRLCGEAFGSALTFGTVGAASAPGQMNATDLRRILELIHMNSGDRFRKNIILIGFMGVGKTSVATRLSEKLAMQIVETDREIVEREGMSIPEIFSSHGEEYFRDRETEVFRDIKDSHQMIISAGGGAVLRDENVKNMKSNGVIILLTATPATILARVRDNTDRPLLNGNMNEEYISSMMERRRARYEEVADLKIDTTGKTVQEVCEAIIEALHAEDS